MYINGYGQWKHCVADLDKFEYISLIIFDQCITLPIFWFVQREHEHFTYNSNEHIKGLGPENSYWKSLLHRINDFSLQFHTSIFGDKREWCFWGIIVRKHCIDIYLAAIIMLLWYYRTITSYMESHTHLLTLVIREVIRDLVIDNGSYQNSIATIFLWESFITSSMTNLLGLTQ